LLLSEAGNALQFSQVQLPGLVQLRLARIQLLLTLLQAEVTRLQTIQPTIQVIAALLKPGLLTADLFHPPGGLVLSFEQDTLCLVPGLDLQGHRLRACFAKGCPGLLLQLRDVFPDHPVLQQIPDRKASGCPQNHKHNPQIPHTSTVHTGCSFPPSISTARAVIPRENLLKPLPAPSNALLPGEPHYRKSRAVAETQACAAQTPGAPASHSDAPRARRHA